MSKAVFITPLAELDTYDAALWYNLKEPGLGNKFIHRLRDKIKLLVENPEQFQKRFRDIRIAYINRFHMEFIS